MDIYKARLFAKGFEKDMGLIGDSFSPVVTCYYSFDSVHCSFQRMSLWQRLDVYINKLTVRQIIAKDIDAHAHHTHEYITSLHQVFSNSNRPTWQAGSYTATPTANTKLLKPILSVPVTLTITNISGVTSSNKKRKETHAI